MPLRLLAALALLALTVVIHSAGMIAIMGRIPVASVPALRFWPVAWLVIRVAWLLIFVHLTEIAVWAGFYWWQQCLPTVESAFYFSGVTYTTVGYGDLILPEEWRLLGPVEGLTGILMCGLSTGFFFAFVNRLFLNPNHPQKSGEYI